MQDDIQNTSITILLVICIAVLASIGIGWFVLDSGSDAELQAVPEFAPEPAQPAVAAPDVTATPQAPAPTIDADLRKARMAAEAEILVTPYEQSALHFYGRVLAADPRHEVANAELDAVLGRLATTASDYLSENNYAAAFRLSQRVAEIRPDHALVNEVQQTLDQHSGNLVTRAMELAEAGDEATARTVLEEAAALPGRNRNYFRAVGESMDDLLQARRDAEEERAESARLAAARETREWMEKVRGAIAAGRLIAPEGDCAMAYLGERDSDDEITSQLREELFSAVLAEANAHMEAGQLEQAETVLASARQVDADHDDLQLTNATLERAFVAREAETIVPVGQLERREFVPASYPRRAEQRGISGWVEVEFTVAPDGSTTDITVANAEPERTFDASALEAVSQWTFQPREFRGQIIAQRATARLVFKLE